MCLDFELLIVYLVLGMDRFAASVMMRMKFSSEVFIKSGWIEIGSVH